MSKKAEYPCTHPGNDIRATFELQFGKQNFFGGGLKRQREGCSPFSCKRLNLNATFFSKRVDEADTLRRDRSSISAGSLRQRRKLSGHGSLVNEQVIQYSLC